MSAGTTQRPRHVAVIGAGILGTAVAARLAGAGLQVTLLDRSVPGAATSRSSLAWLNSNQKVPRAYHQLNHNGMRAWAELATTLDGSAWYRPVGNIEWVVTAEGREALAQRVRRLTDWDYNAHLIDPTAAVELEPALELPEQVSGVAWFPDEGYLLTEAAVERLLAAAVERGAVVRTGRSGEVVGVDCADGAVCGLRTASGESVPVDAAVCCLGRWTTRFVSVAGAMKVPLVPWETPGAAAPGLIVRVGPSTPPEPRCLVHGPNICLRRHSEGVLHLEAPDAYVDLHTPEPELRRWAAELLDRARAVVPALRDAEVIEHRVCVRPIPADQYPVVGWLPGLAGLYVMVTHSGVTLGAHLADLVTTELTTGEPSPALAPYRPERFVDHGQAETTTSHDLPG